MSGVATSYAYLDRYMAAVAQKTANKEQPLRCAGPGCFWCCKEPVYVERQEAKYLIDHYDPALLPALTLRVQAWWDDFFRKGFAAFPGPEDARLKKFDDLDRYRRANLWCPVLDSGQCTAYAQRPGACRLHAVVGSPERCRDDIQRRTQKFIDTDQRAEVEMHAMGLLCENAPCALFEMDHLGIWLGHFLLGKTERSAAGKNWMITQREPLNSLT